jgi:pimeloyl-ACP methyl ester carboxylesterase
MRDMALDALELMDKLGWDQEKVHVVGVSMGGMIAQELALLDPRRVKSLTLASTSSGFALPPSKHIPWLLSVFTKIALGIVEAKDKMPHLLYSKVCFYSPFVYLPAPRPPPYVII